MQGIWLFAIACAVGCSFGDEPDPGIPMLGEGMDGTTAAASGDGDPSAADSPDDAGPGDTTASQDTTADANNTSTGKGPDGDDPGTTGPDDGEADGEAESSTDGASVTMPYTDCQSDDDCPAEYPVCSETSQCSVTCRDESSCPQLEGGAPIMHCGSNPNVCYVLCSGGGTCPANMDCEVVGAADLEVCTWPR